MDVPFVRFAFPLLVLFAFYWGLVSNPAISGFAAGASGDGMAPDEVRALMEQTNRLVEAGNDAGALEPLLKLHNAFPQNSSYMGRLAEQYHRLQRYPEEAAMWEKFLEYAPLPVEACPAIGMAYTKANQPEKAAEAHERCFGIEETSDTVFFMALMMERKGQLAQAKELYERALGSAPNYPSVITGTARVWLKLGRNDDARKLILSHIDRFPDDPDALLVAGMASARTGDRVAARRYLEEGVRLRPADPDFQRELARLGVHR